MKILFFILATLTTSCAWGQTAKNRQSPLAIASARYKDTYLKITYSEPRKNGREIFGKLVPFGQVWRLGANEATELTCTHDIFLSGKLLKAGTYSLFAIPENEKWTLIINSDVGLWGSYNYNAKADVMRIDAPVSSIPDKDVYELFTIKIDQKTDSAQLIFLWDRTQASLPIRFTEPKP
ncbi:MAG: DUF2911 domain-containing protein [Bacteroidetes bacterium]|nr:DUF2911 domain-containing protein [Bacteroidota bacterium]MBS1541860.1 DUF2911 domain-containing protein [Bacteroidota bacterium]